MSSVICGCACDIFDVIAAVDCHVGSGVGVPVDGVEEEVGVKDGVGTTMIIDIEGPERFGRAEHGESRISI